MTMRPIVAALLLAAVAACDSVLSLAPVSEVPEDRAITDVTSARAAVAGIYDALQDGSYYGGDFLFFADLSSDNVEHAGTFTTFRDADANLLRADNTTVAAIWTAMYRTIGRANDVIAQVPNVATLDPGERDQMLGEAYLARALTLHNLTTLWDSVPIRTAPPTDLIEASQIARSAATAVYAQIKSDLNTAEQLMTDEAARRTGSRGAVRAIRARVLMYESTIFPGSADWAAVAATADSVIVMPYALASAFANLFTPDGTDTPEDIYRLEFTPQDFAWTGFYYLRRSLGGRQELRPTADLAASFEPNDERQPRTIGIAGTARYGSKWLDGVGGEDLHIIRLAEVILIKAEALARQNLLSDAVTEYNRIRERAGLPLHTFGVDVTTQQEVLDQIIHERRLELAYEGDRWPDLVRLGRAVSVMNLTGKEYQQLYPVPQSELDVAPNLTQNAGY